MTKLRGPDAQSCFRENLVAYGTLQGQSAKIIQVLLDIRHTGSRPICAEQGLLSNFVQAWEVLQQSLRRDSADIEGNIRVTAHQEERRVHPQRPPSMRQQNLQFGEVYRDIVNVDRVAILVAST